MARVLTLALFGVLLTFAAGVAVAAEPPLILDVPFRSQFDGSPYEDANCGPASIGMVLEAYGIRVPTQDLRDQVNRLAGDTSYDSGTWIYHIKRIIDNYGLRGGDLTRGDITRGPNYHVWTLDEVREHIRAGHPVIPEVNFSDLPGHETSTYVGDHFIVIVGLSGQDFVYHDSAFRDPSQAFRTISAEQLRKAWKNSDFPLIGLAVIPAVDRPGVRPKPTPTVPPTPTATSTATPLPTSTPTPTPVPTATPTAVPAPRPASPSRSSPLPLFFGLLFVAGLMASLARRSLGR